MDIEFVAQRVEDLLDLLDRELMWRFDILVFAQGALRHSCDYRELFLTEAALLAKFAKQLGPVGYQNGTSSSSKRVPNSSSIWAKAGIDQQRTVRPFIRNCSACPPMSLRRWAILLER